MLKASEVVCSICWRCWMACVAWSSACWRPWRVYTMCLSFWEGMRCVLWVLEGVRCVLLCMLSNSCPPSCPPSLCLGFSFSFRLIVLVEVARDDDDEEEVEDGRLIRGRLVGDGKLVREGSVSASRSRGRCRQGGLWVLAIEVGSRSCHDGVCHQGVCRQGRCRCGCECSRFYS